MGRPTRSSPHDRLWEGLRSFRPSRHAGRDFADGNEAKIGRTYPWNNAFQYHLYRKFWPEVEVNYTHFQDGPDNGQTQFS